MPFTLSHPAFVLPLGFKKTRYLDFTALAIGTMSPDFEYFVHFRPIQIIGHTFWGQLYFNLPLVFLLACIYHFVIKKPLILNLPKPFCARYNYIANMSWSLDSKLKVIVFCYSSILGSFTHLFWDAFTHRTGFFVRRIGILSEYISINNIRIPVYNMLQHVSSILGIIAIIIFLVIIQDKRAYKEKCKTINSSSKLKYWSIISLVTLMVLMLRFFLTGHLFLGELIVTFVNGAFIGIVVAVFVSKLKCA